MFASHLKFNVCMAAIITVSRMNVRDQLQYTFLVKAASPALS